MTWQKDNSGSQAHPFMTAGVLTKDCFLGNSFCSQVTIIVPERGGRHASEECLLFYENIVGLNNAA